MQGGMSPACVARLNKELKQLELEPPPGISAWPKDGKLNELEAVIQGTSGTPYAGGTFKLELLVPDRYPFEPPKVRFVTQIYHPNIDSGGRICLDTLNMPPKGQWKPALNLSTVLASVQLLLSEPNPDDGLVPEITQEYKQDRAAFEAKAKALTAQHAVDSKNSTLSQNQSSAHRPIATASQTQAGRSAAQLAEIEDPDDDEDDEEDEEDEEDVAALWGRPSRSNGGSKMDENANSNAQSESVAGDKAQNNPPEIIEDSAEEEEEEEELFSSSILGQRKRPYAGGGGAPASSKHVKHGTHPT